MGKTKIEWATDTWNPVTGCTKVSEGCSNCYAGSHAKRFWGKRQFGNVVCHEGRLDEPLPAGKIMAVGCPHWTETLDTGEQRYE